MIHDAWGGTTGNAGVHRKLADSLDTLDATIAQVYADRSGGEAQTFADWIDANESALAEMGAL